MNLFEKYGGFSTISKIVRQFYQDVQESPQLKHYFEDIEMERLIDHQTKFISHVLGGPAEYTGRTLEAGHRGLSISDADFDEVAEILQENLEDAGMEAEDVSAVMTLVAGTRDQIVTRR